MEAGLLIRMLRDTHKMSREILAEKISVSPNTLAKIENGEREVTKHEIEIISETFNVDPLIFFQRQGHTVINHVQNGTAVGGNNNTVTIDKELLSAVTNMVNRCVDFFEKNEKIKS